MAAGGVRSETLEKIYATYMHEFGLDKPLYQQFFDYLLMIFRGDLGTSFMLYPAKVIDILKQALPWTIALQLPAILVGWILGNLLGAFAAYKKGIFDRLVFPTSLFFSCIPYYCLAIFLLYLFGVKFAILPAMGGYSMGVIPSFSLSFIIDFLKHYILPFFSIVMVTIGTQAIGMREMSIYELNTDYVMYCKNLGMRDNKISKYVFKNAILPQITGLAISLGTMIGGALITEIVFSYPGIGSWLFTAIRQVDYPLIQGCTLIIVIAVLLANFTIDIAYGFIDPRIKTARMEGK